MPFWDRTTSLFAWMPGFAAKLPGWISAVWDLIIEAAVRIAIRLGLWFITIIGALIPPLYAANVHPSLDITVMATQVNNAGLFKDLMYVTVVIALIGFCEILAIVFKFKKPRPLVILFYILSITAFVYFAFFGISEFAHLATGHGETHIVPEAQFLYDLSTLWWAGIIGLALELVLAFQGE